MFEYQWLRRVVLPSVAGSFGNEIAAFYRELLGQEHVLGELVFSRSAVSDSVPYSDGPCGDVEIWHIDRLDDPDVLLMMLARNGFSTLRRVVVLSHPGRAIDELLAQRGFPNVFLLHAFDISHLRAVLDNIWKQHLLLAPTRKLPPASVRFSCIEDETVLLEYFMIRRRILGQMNYLMEDFGSLIEVDEYDLCSIPLAGFVEGSSVPGIIARIVTPLPIPHISKAIEEVVRAYGTSSQWGVIQRKPCFQFTQFRDVGAETRALLEEMGGEGKAVEYTRIMVADERLRGKGLSTAMANFHNSYARDVLGARVGLATCNVKHVRHNLNRNGFHGVIPGSGEFVSSRIGLPSCALYVDLEKWTPREESPARALSSCGAAACPVASGPSRAEMRHGGADVRL